MDLQDNTVEIWKPISGYETTHDVSSKGRVRSWKSARGRRKIPFVLRPKPSDDGYVRVQIYKRGFLIHRLVLLAFVGSCPPGQEACHKDGVRHHNDLTNLRWGTPVSNQADRKRHGTWLEGEDHPNAKLSNIETDQIRGSKDSGWKLAERFSVSEALVSMIRTGKVRQQPRCSSCRITHEISWHNQQRI